VYAVFLERDASEVAIVKAREGDVDVAEEACIPTADLVEK
jgi:hypothetical protein